MFFNSISRAIILVAVLFVCERSPYAAAQGLDDKFNVYGVMAAALQQQWLDRGPVDAQDTSRGAFVFQPEIEINPTEYAMIFARMGFAAGNGLNDGTAPFNLVPWDVEMESDVRDINGSDRDYLLTAWYRHQLELGGFGRLALTAGLIDATDYLDENTYANDPHSQFMNAALVNAPNGLVPSFELGGALEWETGAISIKAAVMNVTRSDDAPQHIFFGVQVGYAALLPMGLGNYRFILARTSHDFADASGNRREPKWVALLSCDQAFNDRIGVWLRIGSQDPAVDIAFKHLFSGGIQVPGKAWGRVNDTVGAGIAYLNGGNLRHDDSYVFESYYRLGLTNMASITADCQYLIDAMRQCEDDARGFILGLRAVVIF